MSTTIYKIIQVPEAVYPSERTSQLILTQAYNSYVSTGDLIYLSGIMTEYFYLTRRGFVVELPPAVLAAAALEGYL